MIGFLYSTKESRIYKLERITKRYPILSDVINPRLHELIENNELWQGNSKRTPYGLLPAKLFEKIREIVDAHEEQLRKEFPEEFIKDPYKYLEEHFKEPTQGNSYLTIVNHKTGKNLGLTFGALEFLAEKQKPLSIWTMKRSIAPLFIGSSIFIRNTWWYNRSTNSRSYIIYDIDAKDPLTPAKARSIGNKLYRFLRNELEVHASVYFSGRGLHVYLIIDKDKETLDEPEDNVSSKTSWVYGMVKEWLVTYDLVIDLELKTPHRLIRLPGSINPRSGYKAQLISGPYGRYYDPYRYHDPIDTKADKKENKYIKSVFIKGRKKGDPSFWVDTTNLRSRFAKELITPKQMSILTDRNKYNIDTAIKLVRREVFKRLSKPIFFSGEVISIEQNNPLLDYPVPNQQRKIISRLKKILNAHSIKQLTLKEVYYLLHMITAQVLLEDVIREKHDVKQYKISDPIILLSRLLPVPIGMRHNLIFAAFNYMRFMDGKGPIELAKYYLLEKETPKDEGDFIGYYNYLIGKTATKLKQKEPKATTSFAYYFPLYMEFLRFVSNIDETLAALLSPVSSPNTYTKDVVGGDDPVTVDQVVKMSTGKLVKGTSVAITNQDDLSRAVQYFIGARFGKAYKIKYPVLFNVKLSQAVVEQSFDKMFRVFNFTGFNVVIPHDIRLKYSHEFPHQSTLVLSLIGKEKLILNWFRDNQNQENQETVHSPPNYYRDELLLTRFAYLLPQLMTADYEELARAALHN